MKTLITYCTTHGCTEKTANELKQFLGGEVVLVNLKKEAVPELESFDRIIIGGSIHAGQIQKKVKDFCNQNLKKLQDKELGLFICCMEEGEKAEIQLQDAFPEILLRNAKATAYLGGEFNFNKMNFFQKLIVKKVAKVDNSVSKIDYDAIRHFSNQMNKIFNPFLFLV
ncbi:flavodoxin domain-containing protein [Draconibacterium sp. IB214405]|uniref:flavodoxin domain-containing protein n=1 Tax=Draconibacterium sp. IB214405 TaxID=3097352 RepID=UPI002A115776|nr:flavodoxin domain-containing protein [Draconibacterium sp. IB214405]MDX8341554.1 flavodoxin domain-containing protein [Draconibacterium sp. IB214405]